ncbi:YhbY family RNA-binding protein [Geminisphaera colitermitum]|uniref:YhbY family RNA-binding protein n=1 Tax=Geminisphaera colitermitum TaxID=1148786 RepID=UPI000158CC3F|nr:YhbY family RNA-binding protein [Geminisphaera colitermitum]
MYEFPLTGAQRTQLRGLGQMLEPAIKLGKGGLSPAFFAELQKHLDHQELVKLRFAATAERDERAALCEQIADEGRCVCVGAVGRTALFYRQQANPERRVVALRRQPHAQSHEQPDA